MTFLELDAVCKEFNGKPAVNDVSLKLERGNILCLLGASGSGKTTLLRIIAGLEVPDRGHVLLENKDLSAIATYRRNFGMMFQAFALFPHKNIFENVAYSLRIQKKPSQKIIERTQEMLDLVGLKGFGHRKVSELSGGEQQRVALARTLAPHPRLIMLDEPLGALDRLLHERLLLDLKRILKQTGITTLFVTHDQADAFAIADEIAVMIDGRITQMARPEDLYHRPSTPEVARFLGFRNFFRGVVLENGKIRTSIGDVDYSGSALHTGDAAVVLIRPEAAAMIGLNTTVADGDIRVCGRVRDRIYRGSYFHLTVATETGSVLYCDIANEIQPPRTGQEICLALRPSGMCVLKP